MDGPPVPGNQLREEEKRMAQWGDTGYFALGTSKLQAVPAVDTGSAFNPIGSDGMIRDVISIHMTGDEASVLLADVKERFVGKSYREWEEGAGLSTKDYRTLND